MRPRQGSAKWLAVATILAGLVYFVEQWTDARAEPPGKPAVSSSKPNAKPANPPKAANSNDQPGVFDFYVLALSWSPSYCLDAGERADPTQCDVKRPYAFVVHGLWPQYNKGWPQDCVMTPPASPTDKTVTGMLDLMPSRRLIRHEWSKHGTCSGLSPEGYFLTVRAAAQSVKIPAAFQAPDTWRTQTAAEIETAFRTANPKIPADGISVVCDKTKLKEVRICMTRKMVPQSCPSLESRACSGKAKLAIPDKRGA